MPFLDLSRFVYLYPIAFIFVFFSQDGVLEVLDSFRTVAAEEGVVVMAAVPQLVEVPLELLVP